MRSRHAKQAGWTLIELVTVIAILGILVGVSLPKFIDISGNARQASFVAIRGAFEESVRSTHTVWFAGGGLGAADVSLEGNLVKVNAAGWPRIDNTATGQKTARNLYGVLMSTPLPSDWASGQDLAAGTADFSFGSTTFRYHATDGSISTF